MTIAIICISVVLITTVYDLAITQSRISKLEAQVDYLMYRLKEFYHDQSTII